MASHALRYNIMHGRRQKCLIYYICVISNRTVISITVVHFGIFRLCPIIRRGLLRLKLEYPIKLKPLYSWFVRKVVKTAMFPSARRQGWSGAATSKRFEFFSLTFWHTRGCQCQGTGYFRIYMAFLHYSYAFLLIIKGYIFSSECQG